MDLYYNASIKKTIAVFGSLFNEIYVGKFTDDKIVNVSKVPISYGPREAYLTRVSDGNDPQISVATKFPRMAYEMTSISLDTTSKTNHNSFRVEHVDVNDARKVYPSLPYKLGFSLYVQSRNLDEVYQIVEQILPNFPPTTNITVLGMDGPNSKYNMPITLTSVGIEDSHEGSLESRRNIIYTLEFEVVTKISNAAVNAIKQKYINTVNVELHSTADMNNEFDHIKVELGDKVNDTPEDHTVITTYGIQ